MGHMAKLYWLSDVETLGHPHMWATWRIGPWFWVHGLGHLMVVFDPGHMALRELWRKHPPWRAFGGHL